MQKDHYKILGVMDTAEDAVIKAAYKALIQIYHPDRFANENERLEATKKAQEINEAYRVLSDPKLRKEYDEQCTSQRSQYQPEDNNTAEERMKNDFLEESWEIAKQFVENLDQISERLALLSPELSFTFKLVLLESKLFDKAGVVASELENQYMEKYFGRNKEIHLFVKWLLRNKKRNIALEVNKAVNVLGANFDADPIISRLKSKYKLQYCRAEEQLKKDKRYYVCNHCDFKGLAKLEMRGDFLLFLFLCVLFIIPGIIYGIWVFASDYRAVCPKCRKTINEHHKG